MAGAFEWMMAARYLRPRREEGFVSIIAGFSLLGIALGVATLIIVMAVMNGFRHELLKSVLGLNGHLGVHGGAGGITDYDVLAARIAGLDGVSRATPVVEGQALAVGEGTVAGVLVRGIRPKDLEGRRIISENMVAGSLEDFAKAKSVLIGARLAQTLGLGPGGTLRLIAPKGTPTPIGTVPRLGDYAIAGTFRIGMYEYDSGIVFMPLDAAQVFFRSGRSASHIEVVAHEPERLDRLRRDVAGVVGDKGRLVDWRQAYGGFFRMVRVQQNVLFLILALIVLVAAFNIISSLTMLVKDKGADIAILRTMGATRGAVMLIFLLTGASVGVAGTAAGLVLGLVFSVNIEALRQGVEGLIGANLFNPEIYFLSELPARIDPAEVAAVVVMALVMSLLATIYPSWRASRLDPAAALRYE